MLHVLLHIIHTVAIRMALFAPNVWCDAVICTLNWSHAVRCGPMWSYAV